MAGTLHRSTTKKDHKRFKLKHATKGQLKAQHKGKVEKGVAGHGPKQRPLTKLERRHTAAQLKRNKMDETKQIRRMYDLVDKNVCVIALTDDMDPAAIAQVLSGQQDTKIAYPLCTVIKNQRFGSGVRWIVPDHSNMLAILDAARVADFVVFGLSATEEVSPAFGEQILRAVTSQGMGLAVGVLPNVVLAYPKRNLQQDIRQSLQKFFNHFFPAEDKMYALEVELEVLNCQRVFCQRIPHQVTWRDTHRGWVLADAVGFDGTHVVVEGTVRGAGLNADHLVHIPDFGDFQVDRIEIKGDTFAALADQELLETLNPEEVEMDGEEWADDDLGVRMEGATYFDGRAQAPRRRFALPKGTLEYQAKWLIDDVLEDVSDVEEADEAMDESEPEAAMDEDDMDDTATVAPTEGHVELSADEEARQLEAYRAAEREDAEWPDELELHPDELGKQRLAAYRGVKLLLNCDWDYDEYDVEAPAAWSRLLRVGNYKATAHKLQKDGAANAQVAMGTRVRVFVRAPEQVVAGQDPQAKPFVVFGLLPHEQKMGVCNWQFDTWEDYEKPVGSDDTMVAQYGPRRVVINPMFSGQQHNKNNVQKYLSFVHGGLAVATAIAPVLFLAAPTLFFKPGLALGVEFVGQGTFLNCDHTRIVAQRAVLTGHPVKIHKRVVTVRYMFFNTDDIAYFKAVPLFTKLGRTGFIKELLGTHGYFKANFDGKLTSQDVVGMAMYKRVWPKIAQEFSA